MPDRLRGPGIVPVVADGPPDYLLVYVAGNARRARSDTKAEIEMEWCEVGSDWSFLDARSAAIFVR